MTWACLKVQSFHENLSRMFALASAFSMTCFNQNALMRYPREVIKWWKSQRHCIALKPVWAQMLILDLVEGYRKEP